jgi:TRAP-type C4-dicarboxylate transport system permease small subunit
MKVITRIATNLDKYMTIIADVILAFMILLTATDVVFRTIGRPILGTYELVSYSGLLFVGFSIPITSLLKGHISVDFLILKLPRAPRYVFIIFNKCLGIGLFLIIGWSVITLGVELREAGEVLYTLKMPYYHVIYLLGICCFIECIVLAFDIVKILGGKHE